MATLQDAINVARGFLQDTLPPYRFTNVDLTQYGNDAITLMEDARPDLFETTFFYHCFAGSHQRLDAASSRGIIDVVRNQNGEAIRPVHQETLDQYRPGWKLEARGVARQWLPAKDSRYAFYLYPPANEDDLVELRHIAHTVYTIDTPLDPRLAPYIGTIADYITGAAEARESEDTGPTRSAKFVKDFIGKIGGAK